MDRRYQRDNTKRIQIATAADVTAVGTDPANSGEMISIADWDGGAGSYPEAFVLQLLANTGNNNLTAGLLAGWDPKGGSLGAGLVVVVGAINGGSQVDLKTARGREFVYEMIAGITHLRVIGTLSAQKLDAWVIPLYRVGC